MNKENRKEFFHRGMMFSGFGPLIGGLVCLLERSMVITPQSLFLMIVSTYLLAFIVAGCSVFYQVEKWSLLKATGFHLLALYLVYLGCYLLNGWLPGGWKTVGIFTGIFAGGYLLIWAVVCALVRATAGKLNRKIEQ